MKSRFSRLLRHRGSLLALTLATALLPARPAHAFGSIHHWSMTDNALADYHVPLPSGSNISFSTTALLQVKFDDMLVDALEFTDHDAHFDSEYIIGSSIRLIHFKKQLIDLISSPTNEDGQAARKLLGRALHTLQDFYSHSNWVELHPNSTSFESRLGKEVILGDCLGQQTDTFVPKIAPELSYWDHGQLGGSALTGLTTAYSGEGLTNFLPFVIDKTTGLPRLRRGDPHNSPDYYIDIPNNKVAHSANLLGLGGCPDGIDKDGPSRPHFQEAYDDAQAATYDYMNQIVTELGQRNLSPALYEKALRTLFHARGTLALVIDTTSSMTPYINAVKRQIRALINFIQLLDEKPEEYLVVLFGDNGGDPNIRQYKTNDPTQCLNFVDGITVVGGGDCPEYSQTGLLSAIDACHISSDVHLFTDASSKDGAIASNVISAAQQKFVRLYYAINGSCSPIDPAYTSGATETGGQFFFLNATDEDRYFDLVRPSLSGDLTSILSAHTTFTANQTRTYAASVDSTVRNAVFSVSSDVLPTTTLMRPSGATVAATDPGVTFTATSFGRILSVASPEAGTWQLKVKTTGVTSVEAKVNSPASFTSFNFVEDADPTSPHAILSPLRGQPMAGAMATGVARLTGTYKTATFRLISEAGDTIQNLQPSTSPEATKDDIILPVTLPSQSFRVAVSGLDANNKAYQRVFPRLYRAQTADVRVDASDGLSTLPAGRTTQISFTVRNIGAQDRFNMIVVDNRGYVKNFTPNSFTLASGSQTTIKVDITVPITAPTGTSDSITATAISANNANSKNGATRTLPVLVRDIADVNGDGYVDVADLEAVRLLLGKKKGQSVFNAYADINNDGVIDVKDLALVSKRVK